MRVLIVKLSSLGDVVQTLPVVQDIARAFPQARVDWVIEESFASLLQSLPAIDRVLVCAQRRWRKRPFDRQVRHEYRAFRQQLRQEAYDVVIDAQGLIKSAWIARQARLSHAGFSVTFANRSELCGYEWPVRFMLDRSVPMPWQIHAVARTRQLAAGALSYCGAAFLSEPALYPFGPRLALEQRAGIWLSHGTTRDDNRWPRAHWVGLGRRLLEAGERLLIPQASPAEAAWAQDIAAELGAGAQVLPRLDLGSLWPVMAQARGVISVDSGLGHLAVGLDLPTVQIFSQDRIRRAGPVGRPHQRAVGGDRVPSVDEVWLAWSECLAAQSHGSAAVQP
jgi:heptosyltransferase-1